MLDGYRFDPRPLLRGHWKSLLDANYEDSIRPDRAARVLLALVPVGLTVAALVFDWTIKAPTPLLSGVALLAGALVGSFGSMSTLRLKLTEWAEDNDSRFQAERDMIDETVAHLLTAALLCAVTAVVLVVGTNTANDKGEVTGVLAAATIALGTYVALLFILSLPRLYSAYVTINSVRPRLNGFDRTGN